jgi:hypothetical protein
VILKRTDRGFNFVVTSPNLEVRERVVQESSSVGEYDDALDRPGSSYLWVGPHHRLDREEVAALVTYLQCWLATGRLRPRDKLDGQMPITLGEVLTNPGRTAKRFNRLEARIRTALVIAEMIEAKADEVGTESLGPEATAVVMELRAALKEDDDERQLDDR